LDRLRGDVQHGGSLFPGLAHKPEQNTPLASSEASKIRKIRAILEKHPDNVDAIQGLAVLCHQRGRPEEALALFRRASRSILTAVLPTGSSADCWSNAAIRWGLRSAIAGPGWKPALLTKRASSAETLRRPPSVNKGRRQGGSIRS
jgi:hypothetical protein